MDEIARLREEWERLGHAGREAEAIPLLTRWIALAPDDPEPYLLRADVLVNAGDRDGARADLKLVTALFPDNAGALLDAGQTYLDLDDHEAGLEAVTRAESLAGDDPAVLRELAGVLEELDELDRAVGVYDRLRTPQPRFAASNSARLREVLGDAEGALRDVEAGLAAPTQPDDVSDSEGSDTDLWARRALILGHQNDYPAALAAARTAIDLAGGPLDAASARAVYVDLLRGSGDVAGARTLAEETVARYPESLEAWNELIRVAMTNSSREEVLATIHRAMEHHPRAENLVYLATMLHGTTGDTDGIVGEWERLVAAAPDDAGLHGMFGSILAEVGQATQARREINAAFRLDPNNSHAWEARAKLLLAEEDGAGALLAVERALATRPAEPELLTLRAEAHAINDAPAAALVDYARALELNPTHVDALVGQGHVQMGLGAYEQALASYEALVRLDRDFAPGLYYAGAAAAALGRCVAAVDYLRRAAQIAPGIASEAANDPYYERCRRHPAFASALRGREAPSGAHPATAPDRGPRPPRPERSKRRDKKGRK